MAPLNSNAVIATVFIGCLNKAKNQPCIDRYNTILFGDSPITAKIDLDPTTSTNFNNSINNILTLGTTATSRVVGLSVNLAFYIIF